MNRIKLLFLAFVLPLISFGQTTELEVREMCQQASEQELVVQASRMMQERFFFLSEIIVDKLLTIKPESANYNYRKGFLILDARQDFEKAMPYLEKAILNTNKNYDMYSPKEESAAVDAFYHLGRCHHLNEDIPNARKYYNKFIELSNKKSELILASQLRLKQCDIAEYSIANPKTVEVINIGKVVNTDMPEYSPVVSLDGTSLYFTSRREWADKSSNNFRDPLLNDFPEDIFVSYQDLDQEWTEPVKLAFCNNELNEATIAVSSDERQIYVYQDLSGGGDIYYSNFGGNQFEELEKLRHNAVNTKFWETHCTLTPDGENMYFVSDRPGGFGGRDIYRIVKLPNGKWSEAQNMGPNINTEYDEDSPFIAINNKTLYYASNGPQSMGGFDIFVAFRDADNVWSSPINMGYPINSCGDDIFYTTTVDGLKGYLSSFRKGGFGEKDIYEIRNDYLGNKPISTLRGKIVNIADGVCHDDFAVKLECLNCDKNSITYPRMKNCNFFSVLGRCKDYKISYYRGDSLLSSETFNTLCSGENEEIEKIHYYGAYDLVMTILDKDTEEIIEGATITMKHPTLDTIIGVFNSDDKGQAISNYLRNFKRGEFVKFVVDIHKEGYLNETFVSEVKLADKGTIYVDYALTKADIGTLIEIPPIYFDLDKSKIRPDAAIELDKIVKIMNDNPTLVVELGSHTDCRASMAYNRGLSSRRAKSSAKYISTRITDPERIYGKGYGESQLVNDCGCEGSVVSDCSEEEHQANRRTEFKIVGN